LHLTRGRHLITAGGRIGATQVNAGTTTAFMGNYSLTGASSGNLFADFLLESRHLFCKSAGIRRGLSDPKTLRTLSRVTLLETNHRTFALTFGYGRSLLALESFEPDFGLWRSELGAGHIGCRVARWVAAAGPPEDMEAQRLPQTLRVP
jgi:hypothetical protein